MSSSSYTIIYDVSDVRNLKKVSSYDEGVTILFHQKDAAITEASYGGDDIYVDLSDYTQPMLYTIEQNRLTKLYDAAIISSDDQYLYKIDKDLSSFSFDVLDLTDLSTMAKISSLQYPEGESPAGFGISPDEQFAYFTMEKGDNLTNWVKIDISDPYNIREVGRFTIPREHNPLNVAFSRDGKWMFTCNIKGFSSVNTEAFNTENFYEEYPNETEERGAAPIDLALSKDGKLAFLANWNSIIDTGVTVMDLRDPANPTIIGKIIFEELARGTEMFINIYISEDGETIFLHSLQKLYSIDVRPFLDLVK